MSLLPYAVIHVTQDKVRVVPIVDVQRIIGRVFAFLTVAVIVSSITNRQRLRARRPFKFGKMALATRRANRR